MPVDTNGISEQVIADYNVSFELDIFSLSELKVLHFYDQVIPCNLARRRHQAAASTNQRGDPKASKAGQRALKKSLSKMSY